MSLSLIAMVWNRHDDNTAYWAKHLSSWHSDPPDEVILIDQSSDHNLNLDNGVFCRTYGHNHFYQPREQMNMALAFNIGIKLAQSDYVAMTGIDWLFSPNFFTVLRSKMGEGRIVSCMGGYLPEKTDLHLPWPDLVKIAEQGEISRRLSPGCCQCVSTHWACQVHGYDERFPAQDGVDDDFRSRAIKAGLESVWVEWTEAQALHQWHPRSPLKGVGSGLFGDAPIVANPQGWGEY